MKKPRKTTGIPRAIHPMPGNVKQMLIQMGLWEAFRGRPPYQQNDYIGWITGARLETTKERRLQQMVHELRQGDAYMKMKWRPSL